MLKYSFKCCGVDLRESGISSCPAEIQLFCLWGCYTAMDATESAPADTVAAETDELTTSPALNEALPGQEVEGAQTEALGNEEGTGTHTDIYTQSGQMVHITFKNDF